MSKYAKTAKDATKVEYDDYVGQVVYPGNEATRIGPEQYVIYDGRLARKRLLTDVETRNAYEAAKPAPSGHCIRELTKGLIMHDPDLYHAAPELLSLEIAYQLADPSLAKWITQNLGKILQVISLMQPAKVVHAAAQMRTHDGTIQKSPDHAQEREEWRDTYAKSQVGKGARTERQNRSHWVRSVRKAIQYTGAANTSRLVHNLEVPEVKVKQRMGKRPNHTWETLTDKHIADIQDDKEYRLAKRRDGAK